MTDTPNLQTLKPSIRVYNAAAGGDIEITRPVRIDDKGGLWFAYAGACHPMTVTGAETCDATGGEPVAKEDTRVAKMRDLGIAKGAKGSVSLAPTGTVAAAREAAPEPVPGLSEAEMAALKGLLAKLA